MNHRESGQQNKGKTISRRAVFQTAFEIIRCKTLWFHHLAKICFPKSRYKKKKKKFLLTMIHTLHINVISQLM